MIPFVDLKAQYLSIKDEIDQAIAGVLESAQFVLGEEVATFERDFASYVRASHAIAVNSGTSALHLALLAAGIGPGDEVVTVPFTFVATTAAIGMAGARATYCDIDPRSFTMDPAKLAAAIGPKTKAVMPVHLYGQAADMDPILEIARARGLVVIEDACQAHGAEYKGRRVGTLGDLGCFSFYPGKNLGAYGEGGAVVTDRDDFAEKVRLLRDWGSPEKYKHVLRGYNYRMEGMQGAILRVKLAHLDDWNRARRNRAERYAAVLPEGVGLPQVMPWATAHVFHVYAVRTARRAELITRLRERGVQTGIHYPIPVHLQPAYADPEFGEGSFPHSETAAREVLSLPMFPELTDEQIGQVAEALG